MARQTINLGAASVGVFSGDRNNPNIRQRTARWTPRPSPAFDAVFGIVSLEEIFLFHTHTLPDSVGRLIVRINTVSDQTLPRAWETDGYVTLTAGSDSVRFDTPDGLTFDSTFGHYEWQPADPTDGIAFINAVSNGETATALFAFPDPPDPAPGPVVDGRFRDKIPAIARRTGGRLVDVVHFGNPLDNAVSWSRNLPSSEYEITPAGEVDAWVTGTEYILDGQVVGVPAEHISRNTRGRPVTGWNGTGGWSEWLEHGGLGEMVFIPDATDMDTYIESSLARDTFEYRADINPIDGTRTITIRISNTKTPYRGY